MAKRRRRVLKTKVKVVLFLILLFILFILIKNIFKKINNQIIDIDYEIVDNYEKDTDIVEKYFADGMSYIDFDNILKYKPEKIKSDKKYTETSYDFNKKLHYSQIEKYLKEFNNSDIVDLYIIGYSVDKRPIYGIEVGNGNQVIYLDANIHAAEVGNTPILIAFLSEILNKYEDSDKSVIEALNTYKLAINPCINPDGYEVYNFGIESLNNKDLWLYKNKDLINFELFKSNANGVDLNRNFPTQNAGLYYSNKPLLNNVLLEKMPSSSAYYGGESLGSEPETRASMYFMLKHYKNIVKYINMHSQGRVIYAGKPNLSDDFNSITMKYAKKVSKINNYYVENIDSEEIGQGNDGSATDFMAELAHNMPFNKSTGRLSSASYLNNSNNLVNKYSVLTLETLRTYTRSPKVYKEEYYNQGIRDVLFDTLSLN